MKKILSIVVMVLLGVTSVWADSLEQKGSITINAQAEPRNGKQVGDVLVQTATATAGNSVSMAFTGWTWGAWVSGEKGATSSSTSKAVYYTFTYSILWSGTGQQEGGIRFKIEADPFLGYYFANWNQAIYLYKSGWGKYDYTANNPTCDDKGEDLVTAYLASGTTSYGPYIAYFAPLTVNDVTATNFTNGSYDANSKTLTFNTSGLHATASAKNTRRNG